MPGVKAVFFDRDNTLTYDKGYTYKIEDLKWIPGAKNAIKFFNEKGYMVFVVTNQSGVARGYYSESDVLAFHEHLKQQAVLSGAVIDEIIYCPHHIEGALPKYRVECNCRKPKPGLILELIERFNVLTENSFLIGDAESDVQAAHSAGIKGYLFNETNLWQFIQRTVLN